MKYKVQLTEPYKQGYHSNTVPSARRIEQHEECIESSLPSTHLMCMPSHLTASKSPQQQQLPNPFVDVIQLR